MADQYKPAGVPVLRGLNVNKGRFHDDDYVFVDDETADRLSKFESFPGDVLMVHKGSLGQIGLMPEKRKYSRYIMGNSMMRVRCNRALLLPEFLYYWLSSPPGQHYIFSRVSQVGVPQIQTPLTTLRQAELLVPSVPEQGIITKLLTSLDEKIELNSEMSATLEAIAVSLFQSWFLDGVAEDGFSSGVVVTSQENGNVSRPARSLSSLVSTVSGGTPRTSEPMFWGGEILWFSVEDTPPDSDLFVLNTKRKLTVRGLESCAASLLPAYSTIISARGTVGNLALVSEPCATNQSCYGLVPVDAGTGIFNFFLLQGLVDALRSRGHGSVFNTITKETLISTLVTVPPLEMRRRFDDALRPLLSRILLNGQQSRVLSSIRDILLPKLISGELRVGDAERILEKSA